MWMTLPSCTLHDSSTTGCHDSYVTSVFPIFHFEFSCDVVWHRWIQWQWQLVPRVKQEVRARVCRSVWCVTLLSSPGIRCVSPPRCDLIEETPVSLGICVCCVCVQNNVCRHLKLSVYHRHIVMETLSTWWWQNKHTALDRRHRLNVSTETEYVCPCVYSKYQMWHKLNYFTKQHHNTEQKPVLLLSVFLFWTCRGFTACMWCLHQ